VKCKGGFSIKQHKHTVSNIWEKADYQIIHLFLTFLVFPI